MPHEGILTSAILSKHLGVVWKSYNVCVFAILHFLPPPKKKKRKQNKKKETITSDMSFALLENSERPCS